MMLIVHRVIAHSDRVIQTVLCDVFFRSVYGEDTGSRHVLQLLHKVVDLAGVHAGVDRLCDVVREHFVIGKTELNFFRIVLTGKVQAVDFACAVRLSAVRRSDGRRRNCDESLIEEVVLRLLQIRGNGHDVHFVLIQHVRARGFTGLIADGERLGRAVRVVHGDLVAFAAAEAVLGEVLYRTDLLRRRDGV